MDNAALFQAFDSAQSSAFSPVSLLADVAALQARVPTTRQAHNVQRNVPTLIDQHGPPHFHTKYNANSRALQVLHSHTHVMLTPLCTPARHGKRENNEIAGSFAVNASTGLVGLAKCCKDKLSYEFKCGTTPKRTSTSTRQKLNSHGRTLTSTKRIASLLKRYRMSVRLTRGR